MVYPHTTGPGVTVAYTSLGQVDTISRSGPLVAYNYAGTIVTQRLYDQPDVAFTPAYDSFGRVTGHQTLNASPAGVNFDYTYDSNGNIISQAFNHRSGAPANIYSYDTLDRLTRSDYHDSQNEQFTYDDLGNRITMVNRDTTTDTYEHNAVNEYTEVVVNNVTKTPAHDAAGNLSADLAGYTYHYDYENRLTSVKKTNDTVEVAAYAYDALGRRVEKYDAVADETIHYYYDGWRVLAEYDDSDTHLRDYVYGNYLDEVLVKTEDSDDVYYAHDHLYSPVALFNDEGTVIERYEYDAYGKRYVYDANFNLRSDTLYNNYIAFTGQRLDFLEDGDILIMYYKNRYYLVGLGRFIQRDPFGINDGISIVEFNQQSVTLFPRPFKPIQQYQHGYSLYSYCGANSINCMEPYGLFSPIEMEWLERENDRIRHELMLKKWPQKIYKIENGRRCVALLRYAGHGIFSNDMDLHNPLASPWGMERYPGSTSFDITSVLFAGDIPCDELCCSAVIWLDACRIGLAIRYMQRLADQCPGKRLRVCGCQSDYNIYSDGWEECPGGYKCVTTGQKTK